MTKFKNFPQNKEDIPHKRGFYKKSGCSTRYGSGVTIFFEKSKPYTCVYEILNIEKYMLAVVTERYLTVGKNDVLGYEINGRPVYFDVYHKYNKAS